MMEGKDGGECRVLECDELTSDVRNLILLIVLIVFLSSDLPNFVHLSVEWKTVTESVKRDYAWFTLHCTELVL